VIQKILLVNRILEEPRLVHRLLTVAPMKVVTMKKMMTNKNNIQISMLTLLTLFFLSFLKMKIQQTFSLSFFPPKQTHIKQKSRELFSFCCCSYYSYFLMLLYISSRVPVSWSYMCVLSFFFVLFAIISQNSFIHWRI
jgi:hypothetical protein